MRHRLTVQVGPIGFRIGSTWRKPIRAMAELYAAYPPTDVVADYTVRLEPTVPWRRWLRPSCRIAGDYMIPEALPLPLSQGVLAIEMAMNLQVALGERRYLLLHAATLERDGQALIMTGESGSGKSTLAALLGYKGWRFMGDEFALIDLKSGLACAFPRPISLKNASIDVVEQALPKARFGALITHTPKGSIRHLVPSDSAIAAMAIPAAPALIVYPRFGFESAVRPVPPSESFVRLTQASTNYVALGERGFDTLTRLVEGVPSIAIDYPDTKNAIGLVEALMAEL